MAVRRSIERKAVKLEFDRVMTAYSRKMMRDLGFSSSGRFLEDY